MAAPARTAKTSQAARHWSRASSAAGPESATPSPVPALTTTWVRSRRETATREDTAWAIAGEIIPVLSPPRITPTASTAGWGASPISSRPSVAQHPAASATARPPSRGASIIAG